LDRPSHFAICSVLHSVSSSLFGCSSAATSLNDHPDIRRVFDGFYIETTPIQYTVGGGKGVERNELIIFSWDDAAQPVGLF
jgi:hypothetical protein